MISPTITKQKESFNRKLIDSRYKKWLKRLENDTPELRQRYVEQHPRTESEQENDNIEHYARIENNYLASIRCLISTRPKDMLMKNDLMRDITHTFTLNKKLIDFHKIPLNSIQLIEKAMTLGDELENLSIICETMDEYEYGEARYTINKILKMNAIPLYEDLYEITIEFADELINFASVFRPYIEQFYETYLRYKSKFEEAHELKRVLIKTRIEEAVINNTLYLHVLVHGNIPYNRNDLVMTKSPINVYQMLHSSPGCIFYSTDMEEKLYDEINLYIKLHRHKSQMIKEVITSLIPMMSKMNIRAKHNTILGRKRSVRHVRNFLDYHRRLPHLFQTFRDEDIINKEFAFDLNTNPLHFTRGINIEGLKVVHSRYIEDTIDLVDYLKLTIDENNLITFTMHDIFEILPKNVQNLVMIDASCQSSQHDVLKTQHNYMSVTKKLK
jgi:hypothetical protein